MRFKYIQIITAIMFLAAVHTASGQVNEYEMTVPAAVIENYIFDYDIILSRSIILSVTQNPNNWRNYNIGVTSGMSGDSSNRRLYSAEGSSALSYSIVDSLSSGNILKDISDNPLEGELLSGTVRKADPAVETFDVIISGGEFPPPGMYSDSVLFKAYSDAENPVASSNMNLSVKVPTIVRLSLVAAGGTFSTGAKSYFLDFGFLAKGDKGFLDMIVRSNVPYSIDFTSFNNGNLANTDMSDPSRVPYSIRVNSYSVDLTSGTVPVSSGTNPTPVTGNRHQIEIEIMDINAASSGNYEDTIQVSVTAQ